MCVCVCVCVYIYIQHAIRRLFYVALNFKQTFCLTSYCLEYKKILHVFFQCMHYSNGAFIEDYFYVTTFFNLVCPFLPL